MLARIDQLDESIERLSIEVARVLVPFSPLVGLLLTIPGVDRRTAEVVLAEIGPDMGRFPSSARLASWAGAVSRQPRVGRQAPARAGPARAPSGCGRRWSRRLMPPPAPRTPTWPRITSAAKAAEAPKAIVAVAHSILVIASGTCSPATSRTPDLGGNYVLEGHHSEAYKNRLIRQLERMRDKVTVEPLDPA